MTAQEIIATLQAEVDRLRKFKEERREELTIMGELFCYRCIVDFILRKHKEELGNEPRHLPS